MKCKRFLRKMSPDWQGGGAVVKVTSPTPNKSSSNDVKFDQICPAQCSLQNASFFNFIYLFIFQNLKAF